MSRRIPVFFLTAAVALFMTRSSPAADVAATSPSPAPAIPPNPISTSNAVVMTKPSSNAPASQDMQKSLDGSTQSGERSSISSVHVDGPYIAMTFDDGPRPDGKNAFYTPKLLDILKERHIHVTFFVLGQMVQEHPELLQRAVAEGHEIGNHSWDHKALNKLGEGGLQHELADTSTLIKQVTGKAPVIMRPPYGATSPRLSRAIEKEYGMKVILWSVDPDDWKDPGPQAVEQRIIAGWKGSGGAKPGAIILSHDIHKGTIEAMPATLDALLAKGYKFVTVSELLAMESKTPPASPSPSPSKPAAN